MAQLIAISDTHCRFDRLEAAIARELEVDPETTAVVHCGDIGLYDRGSMDRLPVRERRLIVKHENPIHLAWDFLEGASRLSLPLVGIPGNHEDFELVERLEAGTLELPGFRLLAPGDVQQLEVAGRALRVVGLGRIAPPELSERYRRRPKYFHLDSLEVTALAGEAVRPDILLLHDPPGLCQVGRRGSFGSAELTEVILHLRPRLVLAGHMHFEYRSDIGGIPVVGLGYGSKGRYAVIGPDLEVCFRDLEGRPPAPRQVRSADEPIDPSTLGKGKKVRVPEARRQPFRRSRLQHQPLPIAARDLLKRYRLGRPGKKDRRAIDRFLAELRAVLVEEGALSAEYAWARAEVFVAERFPEATCCGEE